MPKSQQNLPIFRTFFSFEKRVRFWAIIWNLLFSYNTIKIIANKI